MSSTALISLQDVAFMHRKRKSYFRHEYYEVLSAVTFQLYSGETLGIVGRNGCGKSTLLQLMAGVYRPDKGRIETNGCMVSLLGVAFGFDPELSGMDNVVLSAMLLGASRADARECIDSVIEFSEIGTFMQEPVKSYSTGMRVRLGFSVAITIKSDVVMIDEVLATGDAHFREKAKHAVIEKARSGQTMVLVSHNSQQIAELCDRVIWLENGTIWRQGDPEEVVPAYEEFAVRTRGVGRERG